MSFDERTRQSAKRLSNLDLLKFFNEFKDICKKANEILKKYKGGKK